MCSSESIIYRTGLLMADGLPIPIRIQAPRERQGETFMDYHSYQLANLIKGVVTRNSSRPTALPRNTQ